MAFVAVKLKGIKQYILNTEPAFNGTEPEEHAIGIIFSEHATRHVPTKQNPRIFIRGFKECCVS